MQQFTFNTFQTKQLKSEILDSLQTRLEEIPDSTVSENLCLDKYPDVEELGRKNVSRNKRAVIERMLALSVLESKSKSYEGQSEFECA